MQKRDLKTGMTCVLVNGDRYIVLLATGMGGKFEDILWKPNIFSDRFGTWMPLCDYNEDMSYGNSDDDFEFNIAEVYKHEGPVNIGNVNGYDAQMMFKGW